MNNDWISFVYKDFDTPGNFWLVRVNLGTGGGFAYFLGNSNETPSSKTVLNNFASVNIHRLPTVTVQMDAGAVEQYREQLKTYPEFVGSTAVWNSGQSLRTVLPASIPSVPA